MVLNGLCKLFLYDIYARAFDEKHLFILRIANFEKFLADPKWQSSLYVGKNGNEWSMGMNEPLTIYEKVLA